MNAIPQRVIDELEMRPRRWLVTGAAGFIGSHLIEHLLMLGQSVIGLDNFATGFRSNLEEICQRAGEAASSKFHFVEADIRNAAACRDAVRGVDVILHQAALGSVPRSVNDPIGSHEANVSGFLNMLNAARELGVSRFVYASSSAVYGDSQKLPKIESQIGRPLSPYAATKAASELYADVFANCYGMSVVGLRYFNVFGPRQDPNGPYAAVIPKWIRALLDGRSVVINGDGTTSRDFTYIANVVQANLLASVTNLPGVGSSVFNVAMGERVDLRRLYETLREICSEAGGKSTYLPLEFAPRRAGDIDHSLADIQMAKNTLGYCPSFSLKAGLIKTVAWFSGNALQAS